MMSFENTETAFLLKSNTQLRRSYWIFKLIASQKLVDLGKVILGLTLRLHVPISFIVKKTIFKQFCGGENLKECINTISQLSNYSVGTILDYSVEAKENFYSFEATKQEIISTILLAEKNDSIPFCVFKLSGLGSVSILQELSNEKTMDWDKEERYRTIKDRVFEICNLAFQTKVSVLIDAEESWIQPAIDNLSFEMMKMFNRTNAIVFNTFQLYRKDRLQYLDECIKEAKEQGFILGVKLVRGAYMEKERKRAIDLKYDSPIHLSKTETDNDFDCAIDLCFDQIESAALCIGSHNEKSIYKVLAIMERKMLPKNDKRVHFAQLFGMSDHISFNLAKEGYNTSKYLPYGPVLEVLPYLIRRAEENSSVKGQTNRELSLINKEIIRRKVSGC